MNSSLDWELNPSRKAAIPSTASCLREVSLPSGSTTGLVIDSDRSNSITVGIFRLSHALLVRRETAVYVNITSQHANDRRLLADTGTFELLERSRGWDH